MPHPALGDDLAFSALPFAENRLRAVCSRVRGLIQLGVWDIPPMNLESWLQRFSGRNEQFLACCLLDSLIYRSERQLSPALASLFRGPVRWSLGTHLVPGEADTDFASLLQRRPTLPIRLVPVIRNDQPPTKSGPLIMRMAKRALGIHDGWMRWPWQAAEELAAGKISGVVLVDDFLGSGTQLGKFLNTWGLKEALANVDTTFCYSPIIAHASGLDHLAHEFPRLNVVCAETLKSKHGVFSEENWQRMTQGAISGDCARQFFLNWCEAHMPSGGSIPARGYGNLELSIGFSHSTPNNTLPVYWQSSGASEPLLER